MWLFSRKGAKSIYVGFRLPDGRSVQKSTGETNRAKARARAKQIYDAHLAAYQLTRKGGDITMLGLATEYWDAHLKHLRWATSAGRHLAEITDHVGPDTAYGDVTTGTVSDFVTAQREQIGPATINRALAVWQGMHRYAGEIKDYRVQPIRWRAVKQVEPAGRTRHLTGDDLQMLLRALPSHIAEIAGFAAMTGIRRSQITRLTWDRVNIEDSTCQVWNKSRKEWVPLYIELNRAAMKIIKRRLDARSAEHGLVFNATNFDHIWQKTVKALNLKNFRFHDLRHGFATEATRKYGIAVTQKLLGHSTIRMTERYSHVLREDKRAAVESIPQVELPEDND